MQETCRKLSAADARRKLELELRDAVMGRSRWLLPSETSNEEPVEEDADSGRAAKHLLVARGKKPLSLFDWKIWTMAKPKLWRYGDVGNLFDREEALSTREWAACLLLREARGEAFGFVVSFDKWICVYGVIDASCKCDTVKYPVVLLQVINIPLSEHSNKQMSEWL